MHLAKRLRQWHQAIMADDLLREIVADRGKAGVGEEIADERLQKAGGRPSLSHGLRDGIDATESRGRFGGIKRLNLRMHHGIDIPEETRFPENDVCRADFISRGEILKL